MLGPRLYLLDLLRLDGVLLRVHRLDLDALEAGDEHLDHAAHLAPVERLVGARVGVRARVRVRVRVGVRVSVGVRANLN